MSSSSNRADVFIGLGANLGDRRTSIERAIAAIDQLRDTEVLNRSDFYETEARFVEDQPDFINACIHAETSLPPRHLLARLLEIEQLMGRIRTIRRGPRTIDLDILLYGGRIIDEQGLTIPHRDLHNRRFALEPLADVAADVVHPVLECTVHELLEELTSSCE